MQSQVISKLLEEDLANSFEVRFQLESNVVVRLLCGQQQLIFHSELQTVELPVADFIGYSQIEGPIGMHGFRLNSFPKRSGCCSKLKRKMEHFTFWTRAQDEELERLKCELLRAATGKHITKSDYSLRFIIYLNPNAGASSRSHFVSVRNFLTQTNFTYDLIETTGRWHCKEHLATVQLESYSGVLIISGDGLMHEFVNSSVCGKIAVSHVPGGSGNAFAKIQMTLAGEECRDEEAVFLAVKGRTRELNLVKLELEREPEPIYSFLSLEWAFLADVDMNSQFLRCLGGFRFEIYAAYRCIRMRRYPGKLTYSTTETKLPPLTTEITSPAFQTIETPFLNALFCSIPYISDKYEFAPLIRVEDRAIDMQLILSEHGRWQLIKYLLNSQSGDHFDKKEERPKNGYEFTYAKIKSYRLEPTGEGDELGIIGIDGERYDAQRAQGGISERRVLTFA